MANRWVKYDIISADQANQALSNIHDALNPENDPQAQGEDAKKDSDKKKTPAPKARLRRVTLRQPQRIPPNPTIPA